MNYIYGKNAIVREIDAYGTVTVDVDGGQYVFIVKNQLGIKTTADFYPDYNSKGLGGVTRTIRIKTDGFSVER